MTVEPLRSTFEIAYAPCTRRPGSASLFTRRTASTPVGAATDTRSPVARSRKVVIDAKVGMSPVSPLMPLRRTTTARSSGSTRLRLGAGRRRASTDGPLRGALFDGVRACAAELTNPGKGLGIGSFGQYGTPAKKAIASAVRAGTRRSSSDRGVHA